MARRSFKQISVEEFASQFSAEMDDDWRELELNYYRNLPRYQAAYIAKMARLDTWLIGEGRDWPA